MVLCLFLGLVLAISIICAIPMFSRGILKGIISKDLKNVQLAKNINLGSYVATATYQDRSTNIKNLYANLKMNTSTYVSSLGLKTNDEKVVLSSSIIRLQGQGDTEIDNGIEKSFGAISGIENHIKIIKGEMYSNRPSSDGCYDAIISSGTSNALSLELGKTYYIKNDDNNLKGKKFKIKIAGIYESKVETDKFFDKDEDKNNIILISYPLFKNDFVDTGAMFINKIGIYEYFDYNQFAKLDIPDILSKVDYQSKTVKKYYGSIYFPAYDTLNAYLGKEAQLKSVLYVLEGPIILLIIIYTFMISDLIVDQEKNEIAILKSRGAGTAGICLTYLMQTLVISAAALLTGPPFGLLVCKILGVCNGFLEFINRNSIDVKLTNNEYKYSFIAIAAFIIIMMLPILLATRTTIVQYKQSKSNRKYKPVWEKYFLDLVLLGIAGYGYYNCKVRENYISVAGVASNKVPIDPILYLIMGLFVIGTALLFLRLYPYIVKLVFFIGKNRWSQAAYASLINVSRSKGREQFLMVFLIFTISLGIFDMKAADVINTGIESNQKYLLGADMVLKAWWTPISEKRTVRNDKTDSDDTKMHTYEEPLFSAYQHLNGVDCATKVFTSKEGTIKSQANSSITTYIMGIIPSEFAQIAYFQKNLLPTHWYNYCNALTKDKSGVLISSKLASTAGYQLGDRIIFSWKGSPEFEGIIYGIVDYWPSCNPNDDASCNLIVANFPMLQGNIPVQPYEVWIKKKSPDSTRDIYNSIISNKMFIKEAKDVNQLIDQAKKEPMIQGTNGALTLGFAATMAITAIGFIIYWTLSIRGKALQYGILRAIGLSFKKIIGMILYEQIMISGVAIAVGVLVGQVGAGLFMPLMSLASEASSQAIPSKLIITQGSYTKLAVIVLFIVAVGILSLIKYISSINMDQALKLGED